MAIRYAKQAMTIDGVVFNPGDIVPESLWPALDAQEAAVATPIDEGVTTQSVPDTQEDDESDEDEEDDEEDETVEIEIEGGLPAPELDSTTPEAPKAKGGKSGK